MVRRRAAIRWCVLTFCIASGLPSNGADLDSFFEDYCFECHNADAAAANVNLESLLDSPRLSTRFRTWERIAEMLHERRMPPPDALQPQATERTSIVKQIQEQLTDYALQHAGDPGSVALRRLTSAEYRYTIVDLTGLQFDTDSILQDDAVGGEGFTNVGDVQFLQDSTLERYLDAAKLVASHAVVGSGPLAFFEAPGKTGQELSAIYRIQDIYRQYGFRAGAGEGGESFGLERYQDAFFVCWKFHYRNHLGLKSVSLDELAKRHEVSPRFAHHIYDILTRSDVQFPLTEIIAAWKSLPEPSTIKNGDSKLSKAVRDQCAAIVDTWRTWQDRLARSVGSNEAAVLLTEDSVQLSKTGGLSRRISWAENSASASVSLITASATATDIQSTTVIWKNPRVAFRLSDESTSAYQPLVDLLPENSELRKRFGEHPAHDLGPTDLAFDESHEFTAVFPVPRGATRAQLRTTVEVVSNHSHSDIVRCTVRDNSSIGDTAADVGEVSVMLGPSSGPAFDAWKAGTVEFARLLPPVSHREPAPSDRDPIPDDFDNSYNNAQRNDFHYSIKYHRDDEFLVEMMLDDATRVRLQHAWNDLLSSFDYHHTYAGRVRDYALGRELDEPLETLPADWQSSLSDATSNTLKRLNQEREDLSAALTAAEPNHLQDAIEFASRAWRRTLSPTDASELRSFYFEVRDNHGLSHVEAVRALLVRILCAPAFLYHIEESTHNNVVGLSGPELASRLSYFLWSSPPDDELRSVAATGRLLDPMELQHQSRRMLRDAKSRRFATEFFGQWFGFYHFDKYRGIDSERFPELTSDLKRAMYVEAREFFGYVVSRDRPCDEILFADYAFWNVDLARHYGFLQATSLPADQHTLVPQVTSLHRGGLLSLAVVHATTSAPLRTSAVKRGDWILRRVLGTPVPPPPADAGSIPADDVLTDGKTVRDRLVAHRKNAACVNCHSRMDPLGFALENFDPIGRWRQTYRDGQQIDTAGVLNDGTELRDFDELKSYLRSELPKFHRTLCSKLLGYALGRKEILSDRPLIELMLADLKSGSGISNLVARLVSSPQFRSKRPSRLTTSQ